MKKEDEYLMDMCKMAVSASFLLIFLVLNSVFGTYKKTSPVNTIVADKRIEKGYTVFHGSYTSHILTLKYNEISQNILVSEDMYEDINIGDELSAFKVDEYRNMSHKYAYSWLSLNEHVTIFDELERL